MNKKIQISIFFIIFLFSVTACVPPGTESYYSSEYEADSKEFNINLNVIQSGTPAPKESTLFIESKENEKVGENEKNVKIYFRTYDGFIEGKLGQPTIIDVTKIPSPLLNGLDFEAVLVYEDRKEDITFHRNNIERNYFKP